MSELGAALLAALAVAVLAGECRAQAAKSARPAAKPAPPSAAAPGAPDSSSDPDVAMVLAAEPRTPEELVRAAGVLLSMKRPEAARPLLAKVVAMDLSEEQSAAISTLLATEVFAGLEARADLAPAGAQLAAKVRGVLDRQRSDPDQVARWIRALGDPAEEVRVRALVGLRTARAISVPALLAALIDDARAAERPAIEAALAFLGEDALRPLIALAEADDAKVRAAAIRTLGSLGNPEAALYVLAACWDARDAAVRAAAAATVSRLWGKVPERAQAARLLAERAREYARGTRPIRADDGQSVTVFQWDAARRQVVSSPYPVDAVRALLAARFARDAQAVLPQNQELGLLGAVTLLEKTAYEGGISGGHPAVRAVAAQLRPELVQQALARALDEQRAPAAAAAAAVLGAQPAAEGLLHAAAQPAPLVRALHSADRRVRFAALEAIMALRPSRPYPGSSAVAETLAYFLATQGRREVLLGGTRIEKLQAVGAHLAALGYSFSTVGTGKELIAAAARSPDCELLLVDVSIDRPTAELLVEQLRHDGRTASLPVGLLAQPDRLAAAGRIAAMHPHVEAFAFPFDLQSVHRQVTELLQKEGRDVIPPEQRKQQARLAVQWLAELSASGQTLYDLSRAQAAVIAAAHTPELGLKALEVLGNIANPQCQQALVSVATAAGTPIERRRAAAAAFREAVKRRGVQLTRSAIAALVPRLRQDAARGGEDREIAGALLYTLRLPPLQTQALIPPPAPVAPSPPPPTPTR